MSDFKEDFIQCSDLAFLYGDLVAFYLTDEQLQHIKDLLTEDDPPCGAVGRYITTPVFRLSDAPDPHTTSFRLIKTDDGITIQVRD